MTSGLWIYRRVAQFAGPLAARWILRNRARRGKEDPQRLSERFGVASVSRPDGPVIWLHAASVGETLSLLPLVTLLQAHRPDLAILVTTGTRSSSEMLTAQAPPGVLHQYAPVDTVSAVAAFLDYWRPSFLGIAESELWPNMITETAARGTPVALLSARLSTSSAQRWRRAPSSAKALLSHFSLILAQTAEISERFERLGAAGDRLKVVGSLKASAQPLPYSSCDLASLLTALGDRPRWLAASTHPGEETSAIAAHKVLKARDARVLTIVAPRHPERAEAVLSEARAAGLAAACQSGQALPTDETEYFVVDRLGELGLWFRAISVAFVGGSLAPLGGHNPLEPARLNAAVLFGPHVEAFQDECAALIAAGGAQQIADDEELAHALVTLLGENGDGAVRKMANAAAAASAVGADVAAQVFDEIAPLLPVLARADSDNEALDFGFGVTAGRKGPAYAAA